jgi:hypothetical protein
MENSKHDYQVQDKTHNSKSNNILYITINNINVVSTIGTATNSTIFIYYLYKQEVHIKTQYMVFQQYKL